MGLRLAFVIIILRVVCSTTHLSCFTLRLQLIMSLTLLVVLYIYVQCSYNSIQEVR